MSITKPAVRTAWADSATTAQDIIDPGNAYVAAGWLESITPPSRQFFNWLINYCMNGVRYLSRRGVTDYDALETYQIGDVVIGDDGMLRQSLTANQGGNLPSTSVQNWAPLQGYATTTAVSNAIAGALLPYATNAGVAATLLNYVTNPVLQATLAAYVTNASLAATLGNYPTNTVLNAILANYATVASLSAYETVAAFNAAIAGYLPKTGGYLSGDLYVYRAAAPTTGVVFLNQAGTAYVYYDGTNYQMPNGSLIVGGLLMASQAYATNVAGAAQNAAISAAESYAASVAANAQSAAQTYATNVAGAAQNAAEAYAFGSGSITATGWTMLPNGLILQWGVMGGQATNNPTVSMARAFPTACFSATANSISPTVGNAAICDVAALPVPGATTFKLNTSIESLPASWSAIGH